MSYSALCVSFCGSLVLSQTTINTARESVLQQCYLLLLIREDIGFNLIDIMYITNTDILLINFNVSFLFINNSKLLKFLFYK